MIQPGFLYLQKAGFLDWLFDLNPLILLIRSVILAEIPTLAASYSHQNSPDDLRTGFTQLSQNSDCRTAAC